MNNHELKNTIRGYHELKEGDIAIIKKEYTELYPMFRKGQHLIIRGYDVGIVEVSTFLGRGGQMPIHHLERIK